MRYDNNSFIGRYSAKMKKSHRIMFIIGGLIPLIIDAVILYALYAGASWLNTTIAAPGVFTIILLLLGVIIFGSIIVTLLIFGFIGLYVGIVG